MESMANCWGARKVLTLAKWKLLSGGANSISICTMHLYLYLNRNLAIYLSLDVCVCASAGGQHKRFENRENMQITNINFLFECMNEAWKRNSCKKKVSSLDE